MPEKIPKIQKLIEVGETPFQFIRKDETILQGWNKETRKMIYLFKTTTGAWGYYDKISSQVIEHITWKEKSALIDGQWIRMGLYHRIVISFSKEVSYSKWDKALKKEIPATTKEAVLIVTDTTYKQIMEVLKGRNPDSLLKFEFTSRKIGTRTSTFIKNVVWLS